MKKQEDIAKTTSEYFETKLRQEVKNIATSTIKETAYKHKENKISEKHKQVLFKIKEMDDIQSPISSHWIDDKRDKLYEKRENILTKQPFLESSMSYVDKETIKKAQQKQYFNQRKVNFENNKERDLDNDGIPDRIDIDDTRNAVQTTSDLSLVGNSTDKATNKQNKKKNKNNKYTLEKNRINNKKSLRNSIDSSKVGKRNLVQKTLLAPGKPINSLGRSIKKSFDEEAEQSQMEGVKFANQIVSPMAKKLKYETNSFVARKIGFDRKAYKLQKVEKQIMKADKKAFAIKKAQQKRIRKTASKNAKTITNKAGLMNRLKTLFNKKDATTRDFLNLLSKRGIEKYVVIGGMALFFIVAPIVSLFPVIASTSAVTSSAKEQSDQNNQINTFLFASLPETVMRWEEDVKNELKKYGKEQYTDLALVIIQLESGGRSETIPDIMQSSESIGLAPNTINNPKRSIEVGIKYLNSLIDKRAQVGVDIQTMIHSYNYGAGFMDYIKSKSKGTWSQELANSFSDMWKAKLGWSIYGDPSYVQKALKYLAINGDSVKFNVNFNLEEKQMAWPVPNHNYISSYYGNRIHPINGGNSFHTGIDIPAPAGTPIIATADGVVSSVVNGTTGYGKYLIIDHGLGIQTLYAHNSKIMVTTGQTVKAGDTISLMGTTGASTGNHLHYEIRVNGQYIDPLSWLNK